MKLHQYLHLGSPRDQVEMQISDSLITWAIRNYTIGNQILLPDNFPNDVEGINQILLVSSGQLCDVFDVSLGNNEIVNARFRTWMLHDQRLVSFFDD